MNRYILSILLSCIFANCYCMESGKRPKKPQPIARKRSRSFDDNNPPSTEKTNLLAAAIAVGAAQDAARSRGLKLKVTIQETTNLENQSDDFVTLTGRLKEMARKRAEENTCCDCFFVGFFKCCPCIDHLCDKCTDCLDCLTCSN